MTGSLLHVSVSEELEEQDKESEVDEKRPEDIIVGDVASVALLFLEVGVNVHPNTDDHLSDL